MKLVPSNPYYHVHWCEETTEFGRERPFPLVYMNNGELCYSLLAYLKHLYSVGAGKHTSSLYDLFRCISEITIFYERSSKEHTRWKQEPRTLIIDYFEKSLHGTIHRGNCNLGLWWEGSSVKNIKRKLRVFSKYEEFCAEYLSTDSLRSTEILCQSTIEYNVYRKRQDYSLLKHLKGVNTDSKKQSVIFSHGQEPETRVENSTPNFFPPELVTKFIESALDDNQRAIYLLCAFTGLRASEAMHVLISDVVVNKKTAEFELIVSHPVSGSSWCHETRRLKRRKEILGSYNNAQYFDPSLSSKELQFVRYPIARVNVPKPLHLGWKGVLLEPQHSTFGYVVQWTEDAAKLKFFEIVQRYLLSQKRCNHPYLFCSKNGAPLSISTYSKRFERESLRLTGDKYNPHSLRHFTGFYICNYLDVSIDIAQKVLRHHHSSSTQRYFNMSAEKFSETLKKAKGIEINEKNKWKQIPFREELLKLR